MKHLYEYIFENKDLVDELIDLYKSEFDNLSRHSKVHLLTRGNLIKMFSKNKMIETLKYNADKLSEVIDLFNNDIDKLIDKYVLIGYKSKGRKADIGELFKSVNTTYKKFLCIVTILEMTYTFQRVNMLNMIDIDNINNIINDNIDTIKKCIKIDKYNFKKNASTKYINSLYFITNLRHTLTSLDRIVDDINYNECIDYFIDLYKNQSNETTIYGITHILIGASDFYQKQINDKYYSLVSILEDLTSKSLFNKLSLDLRIEILLCCKLFGHEKNIDLSSEISKSNLDKNEHTNMLYILLKKYEIS